MKTINRYLYNVIFWISRALNVFIFSICLYMILHAKYAFLEKYLLFDILFKFFDFINVLFRTNRINDVITTLYYTFCRNSPSIDLLLIVLILILVISIILIRYVKKENKYLLTVSIISSISYLIMYTIFKLPIMIALAVSTPIILLSIYILNKRCPIQEVIVLIPIIGEIFCTKKIIQYIFKNNFNKIANFSLLLTALIVSNVICFLFPYKTEKDFENRIMDNWTYSIRPYEDKLIISGYNQVITIDQDNIVFVLNNNTLDCMEDFTIYNNKKELYCCNSDKLLTLDIDTLNIIHEIDINIMNFKDATRIHFDYNFQKLIVVYESSNSGCLIDFNKHIIKYLKKTIAKYKDGLIYNKHRNSFLISFHDNNKFLQEIDVEQKKIRKIKTDKHQGYLAMSERNKEIYVAFHQQGRIGVYDAETMKLKRKIRSNYTVKDITYDEELNILIAPSYFTGYVDIFLMDGNDKLLTREFVGYELREGCFDSKKENLYVCSMNGLYKKKIGIKKLIEENSK